ncbi:MAG: TetR/AcrR family transcriptional regulator [Chloroflexi bacterium]|nr:TetR/AcrR family transcriptional regulator [Chloroflexota bacterium]MDL1942543.1 TetR/AcrR family transcriptional regulator [Chloroflexi bacterium CFX2]
MTAYFVTTRNIMSKNDPESTQETRIRILEAAVKVFATKGYHDAKVDDIVGEAQTSKGAFYFYFPSKQDIFIALSDTFADLLESKLTEAMQSEAHGLQQMDAALRASLGLFSQYRGLAKIALVQAVGLGAVFEDRRRAINDRLTRLVQTRLEAAAAEGSIPPLKADLAARAWVGALNEIVTHWIYAGSPPLEETLPELRKFLARSIGVPEEKI